MAGLDSMIYGANIRHPELLNYNVLKTYDYRGLLGINRDY